MKGLLRRIINWVRGHRRASVALAAALVAAVLIGVFALSRRSDVQYFTSTVEEGDIIATVQATGTIGAVTTVQVGSQVSGRIDSILVDFNSQVKKGQLVARIDSAPFQARLLQAEADLASAQAGVKSLEADLAAARANLEKARAGLREAELKRKRTVELFEQGIASQQEREAADVAYETAQANQSAAEAQINQTQARVEQGRAGVKQSQARLEQARLDLQNTFIQAPIDGTVIARNVDVGQTVAASLQAPTLFTIAQDLTQMQVYAKTDESDVGRIRVGVDASFKVDSFPQDSFRGSVKQVRMNAYQVQNVVTYDTIVEFENPEGKLLPGMTAYVTIPVATARGVVKIPNGALRYTPDLAEKERRALLAKYNLLAPPAGPDNGQGTVHAQEQKGGEAGAGQGRSGDFRERLQKMSPEERAQMQARWQARQAQGNAEGGSPMGPRSTPPASEQILWKLRPDNTLQPVRVKTGVTDFTFTALVEGELRPGDKVVIGQTFSARRQQSPLGPGGMRRF
ncbi:MAG: efflux RND transporter periplasmic adaptor subunit [Candidatus Acidiferrales bacterium]